MQTAYQIENQFQILSLLLQSFGWDSKVTRLKGFSPKREQRLWKLFQISGRDFKVRAKMTIENF